MIIVAASQRYRRAEARLLTNVPQEMMKGKERKKIR